MGGGPQRKHKVFSGSTWACNSSFVILPPGKIQSNPFIKRPIAFLANLQILAAKGRKELSARGPRALLTAEKRREVGVHVCALVRDVEITGEPVREFPARFDDGALQTHAVAAHQAKHKRLRDCIQTRPRCRRKARSEVRP